MLESLIGSDGFPANFFARNRKTVRTSNEQKGTNAKINPELLCACFTSPAVVINYKMLPLISTVPCMPTPLHSKIIPIRSLGLIASISIVIGSVIGAGIFLKSQVLICNVGSPIIVTAVWIGAGLMSLAGALTYAELGAMMPRTGGDYVFLREAYGPLWGFLYGWMRFCVANSGAQAAGVVAFATFLNIVTGGALHIDYFTLELLGYEIRFGPLQAVSLGCIAVVTLINCATVSTNGKVAAVMTGIKIVLVLTVGVTALMFAPGDWAHFAMTGAGEPCEGVGPAARGGLGGFGAAMLGALWAYNGWNSLTLVGGEIKDPQRNIPLALICGTVIIVALYSFINLAYFYALTPAEVANISRGSSLATAVAGKVLGPVAAGLVAAALLASSFGALHTAVMTNARVPYAMAGDGLFFKSYAKLSPRTRVPVKALILQAQWTSVLALASSLDALTDYVMFAVLIFYILVVASVFIFRHRMPNAERPYRTWGYPVVPALFLLVAGWLVINSFLMAPSRSLLGLGLIAMGLPVYWLFRKQSRN
ncbi:MAG TPA: amino acid permease [Blastocatellia bacterium]|nr:amino acid permease [Blastocatellia bacterium]